MKQVQAELEIADAEIQPQLSDLARLRFLRQVREGDLQVINPTIMLKKKVSWSPIRTSSRLMRDG